MRDNEWKRPEAVSGMATQLDRTHPGDPATCDRCGAMAMAQTNHPNAGVLTWCKHHFNEHEDALTPFLVFYVTETSSKEHQPA